MAVPGERPQTPEAKAIETALMEALSFIGVDLEKLEENLLGKETEFNSEDLWDIAFMGLAFIPGGKGFKKVNYPELIKKLKKQKTLTPRAKEYLAKAEEIVETAKKQGIDPNDVSHTVKFPKGFDLPAKVQAVKQSVQSGKIGEAIEIAKEASISSVSKKERALIGKVARELPPPSDILKPIKAIGEKAAKVTSLGINAAAEKILFERAKRNAGIKTVNKLMARTGMSEEEAVKIIQNKKTQEIINGLFKKGGIALAAGGLTWGTFSIGKSVVEADAMADWGALDNIMGTQSFLIKELVDEAQWNEDINIQEVRVKINDSLAISEIAENKIIWSTEHNPLGMVNKELWLTGIDSYRLANEERIGRLDRIQERRLAAGSVISSISKSPIEDPEERKAVLLEQSEQKGREEAEREKRSEPRPGRVSTRTERSVGPSPERRSKLGFGI